MLQLDGFRGMDWSWRGDRGTIDAARRGPLYSVTQLQNSYSTTRS